MKPTIIKNNFFENPEEVIKYSKQITWKKPSNQDNWPGLRSDNLFEINQKLHDDIVEKIVKLYFNGYKVSIESTNIQFHKITYEDWLLHDKKNTRIHKDFTDLAGIIYLNQDTNNFIRVLQFMIKIKIHQYKFQIHLILLHVMMVMFIMELLA